MKSLELLDSRSRRGGSPARGGRPAVLSSWVAEGEAPRIVAVLRLRKNYEKPASEAQGGGVHQLHEFQFRFQGVLRR